MVSDSLSSCAHRLRLAVDGSRVRRESSRMTIVAGKYREKSGRAGVSSIQRLCLQTGKEASQYRVQSRGVVCFVPSLVQTF